MAKIEKKPVKIVETVLRDAHQSLIATRMTTEQMLPIIDKMDKVGYHAVECWGGATFDASLRFLKEDPWERLRKLRAGFKNTKLQMLFRGQNILGYNHYADDVVEYFVQKSIANGIDIIRIDAVPYIWKELGTQCRNLPQVHTIVRMMRMIGEIVCPGILLLGEVVMEPEKVVPYFGTVEKPECHMLYNVTTMATTWHTIATRNVHLLKQQLDIVNRLPKDYVFLNYLRCHDDIGWGLDYESLKAEGIDERAHKKYLNDYFQGYAGESCSRGELYNADPVTGDARFCGTTASMCGIEKAGFEQDMEAMEQAIQKDIMLHAYMFMQSGIPVLYSGDEVAQVNDYSYKEDPNKADDSRYIHRGPMRWDLAEHVDDENTVEGQVYQRLQQLEKIRKSEKAFMTNADTWTIETWDAGVLCIGRYYDGDKILGLFNFTEYDKTAWINETDGEYIELLTGKVLQPIGVNIPAYGFYYLKKIN